MQASVWLEVQTTAAALLYPMGAATGETRMTVCDLPQRWSQGSCKVGEVLWEPGTWVLKGETTGSSGYQWDQRSPIQLPPSLLCLDGSWSGISEKSWDPEPAAGWTCYSGQLQHWVGGWVCIRWSILAARMGLWLLMELPAHPPEPCHNRFLSASLTYKSLTYISHHSWSSPWSLLPAESFWIFLYPNKCRPFGLSLVGHRDLSQYEIRTDTFPLLPPK